MAKLAILTLHGMGDTKPTYADGLRKHLRRHLGADVFGGIFFEPIYYQDIIQENQRRVWHRMPSTLRWVFFRRFMLYYFSDAAAIQYQARLEGSVYLRTQARVRAAAERALGALPNPDAPVIIIAQSLGGQVVSSYLWDAYKQQGTWQGVSEEHQITEFLKLQTTRYLFTTGCNIPLFVSGLERTEPITRPNQAFEWLNFYDADDPLGWPLQPLSEAYGELVRDVPTNVGNLFTNWNPLSHTAYWTSESFLEPIAARIQELYETL